MSLLLYFCLFFYTAVIHTVHSFIICVEVHSGFAFLSVYEDWSVRRISMGASQELNSGLSFSSLIIEPRCALLFHAAPYFKIRTPITDRPQSYERRRKPPKITSRLLGGCCSVFLQCSTHNHFPRNASIIDLVNSVHCAVCLDSLARRGNLVSQSILKLSL